MDIVCLGEVLIDMFPAEIGVKLTDVSAFRPKPGGAPANVAVAAARLGAQSAFIGKVGDDLFGHYLENVLKTEGVNTVGMRYDEEARTTMAIIAKPDENTSEFVFYRNPGADTRLKPEEIDLKLLQKTKCLHFGSLSLTHEPSRSATIEAVNLAHASGALISFDVNYRPSLWKNPHEAYERAMTIVPNVDLLKVNETELVMLGGSDDLEKATNSLLQHGPDLIVVTLGPEGSFFQTADGSKFVKGFKVKTVDATGCGDAFIAGLLCQIVGGDNWRDNLSPEKLPTALRYANAVGALTSQYLGVIPALPTAERVNTFLNQVYQ
jgi:fructokinase